MEKGLKQSPFIGHVQVRKTKLGGSFKCEVFLGRCYGIPVAVKQVKPEFRKEFTGEVNALSNYRHENIANLLAWIDDKEHLYLIYEHFKNGSLQSALATQAKTIQWRQRVSIAKEIGKALAFLQSKGFHPKDLKSSNVLLNGNYSAKVKCCVGSRRDGKSKCDTFSFGVILMELLTGMNTIELKEKNLIRPGSKPKIVNWNRQAARKLLEIAYKCFNNNVTGRPNINEILKELETVNYTVSYNSVIHLPLQGKNEKPIQGKEKKNAKNAQSAKNGNGDAAKNTKK